MEYRRIFDDAVNLLVGRAGTIVIGLLNMMILARILTTEEMGSYSLFMMIINLGVQLGLSWSGSSILRYGREEFVKRKKVNKTFWARSALFVPMVFLFIMIYLIFAKQIAAYINTTTIIIPSIIFIFVLTGLLYFIMMINRSLDQVRKSAYVLFFQKLIYLLGLLLLFFKAIDGHFLTVVLILNVSFLFALVINLIGFKFNTLIPVKFDNKHFKKIWKYSWPQLMGFSGLYLVDYVDLYIIRNFLSISDVGIYNVAYNGFKIIASVILILNTLFLPLIVEYRTKKQYDHIKTYISKIPLVSILWIFLVIFGVLTSKFIIPFLFSEKYVQAIPSFNILLITSIFYFIYVCLMPLVNGFDIILYNQIFNLIKSVIKIIAGIILVPMLGIIGAAYATLLSFIIGVILTGGLVYTKRNLILGKKNQND